jgi:hypothetical protein
MTEVNHSRATEHPSLIMPESAIFELDDFYGQRSVYSNEHGICKTEGQICNYIRERHKVRPAEYTL